MYEDLYIRPLSPLNEYYYYYINTDCHHCGLGFAIGYRHADGARQRVCTWKRERGEEQEGKGEIRL